MAIGKRLRIVSLLADYSRKMSGLGIHDSEQIGELVSYRIWVDCALVPLIGNGYRNIVQFFPDRAAIFGVHDLVLDIVQRIKNEAVIADGVG